MKYQFLIVTLFVTILYINNSNAIEKEIVIQNGVLIGNQYPSYSEYLGIPFAKPPIGNLRWASPVAADSWGNNVYNATFGRDGCPQQCNLPAGVCPYSTSEDCLNLNVYTPNLPEGSDLVPVMVFIPGGRFNMGAAYTPLYDGQTFCNQSNVILVTINYRIGVLGFLTTPTLTGNYGFEDQILALQWVQDNIKSFGGDPTQVTLFGESAGGTSSAIHLTSPASKGLFSKLIIESNPWSLPVKTPSQMEDIGNSFAKDIGCKLSDTTCLYSKSVEDILNAQNTSENGFSVFSPLLNFLPWTPVVDGKLILDQPLTLIQQGQFNQVPVLMGTVRDEALIFIASISTSINALEFKAGMFDIFKFKTSTILNTYDQFINSTTNYMYLLSRIGTDYIFVCPTRNAAAAISKTGLPVFTYQLQHITSFNVYVGQFPQCADAVCHGLELPYVFDTASEGGFTFQPDEQALSLQTINYWTNFAKNGNPNIGNPINVQWPSYNSQTDLSLILQTPPQPESNLLKPFCDVWDSLGYQNGW
eukprot:gene7537-9265_t